MDYINLLGLNRLFLLSWIIQGVSSVNISAWLADSFSEDFYSDLDQHDENPD